MSTRKNTTKPAAPPVRTYPDGARVRLNGSPLAGSVVSTDITENEYSPGHYYEMVTVKWDDAPAWAETVFHACVLEPENMTDDEKRDRDYDDAVSFARMHD